MEILNEIKELVFHPKLSDDYKIEKLKFFITTEYVRSSNVDAVSYNDVLKEMVIRFNDGSTYTYYDVSLRLFDDIKDGNGVCITTGQNQYGRWKIGKSPSVGAAVYEKLVQAGVKYKKGGTII